MINILHTDLNGNMQFNFPAKEQVIRTVVNEEYFYLLT